MADVKNMNSGVHKVKKKKVCMNLNQLCSINYDNSHQKRLSIS